MGSEIRLRFYEELNDYLTPESVKREFDYQLDGLISIGQILQNLNVPVSKVELVIVNGSSVGLTYCPSAGDRVSIYPVFESFDVKSLIRLRAEPLRVIRFTVDPGLGRLAFYLHLLGFDVLVDNPVGFQKDDRRILLTRNSTLLNSGLSHIYVIRKENPRKQLKEVLCRFNLFNSAQFSWLQSKIARLLAC